MAVADDRVFRAVRRARQLVERGSEERIVRWLPALLRGIEHRLNEVSRASNLLSQRPFGSDLPAD